MKSCSVAFVAAALTASLLMPATADAGIDAPVHHIRFESDADHGLRQANIEGGVAISADAAAITALADGAYVLLVTERNGEQSRFEARPGTDGEPVLALTVAGTPRSAAEAARWCAEVLPIACRETALATDERVRAAYDRDGMDGVLVLLDTIRSDYAAMRHFDSVLALDGLTDAEISAALDLLGGRQADRRPGADLAAPLRLDALQREARDPGQLHGLRGTLRLGRGAQPVHAHRVRQGATG